MSRNVFQQPHRRKACAASIRRSCVTSPGHLHTHTLTHSQIRRYWRTAYRQWLILCPPGIVATCPHPRPPYPEWVGLLLVAACTRTKSENRGYGRALEFMADCFASLWRDTLRWLDAHRLRLAVWQCFANPMDLEHIMTAAVLLGDSVSSWSQKSQSLPSSHKSLIGGWQRTARPIPCSVGFRVPQDLRSIACKVGVYPSGSRPAVQH